MKNADGRVDLGTGADLGLAAYRALLERLRETGYAFHPVSGMPQPVPGRVCYLRHDVALHLARVDEMAQVEAELGARATYCVLMSAPYNPASAPNRAVLRRLVELGHEVGLHYDLSVYPSDPDQAAERLEWEAAALERLTGAPVRTVSPHLSHAGGPDPFREGGTRVHPLDPRWGAELAEVSDGRRAWRDEGLLARLGPDAPRRLLLLTHPELWLDAGDTDRVRHLDGPLWENGAAEYRAYLEALRQIWAHDSGARMHDAREAARAAAEPAA
jgi:hypothetical protein